MKRSRLVSICLALVLMFSGFSACTSYTEKVTPDPVDLSVLTEDELGKINHVLLDTLMKSDKDDAVSIMLDLVSPLGNNEVESLANKRIKRDDISYNQAVYKIFDETNTPIIEDVIADYGLKIPHRIFIATFAMSIDCISANAQTVIDLAKDERVESICVATVSYEDAASEIESVIAARV